MANLLALLSSEGVDTSVLEKEEEDLLVEQVKAGSYEARNKLLLHNSRFIKSQAKKFYLKVMSARKREIIGLDDLVQEGIVGFSEAITRFDPEKGCKLISFAIWSMQARWISYIRKYAGAVRLPANRSAMITKLLKARDRLQQKLSREPCVSELAKELGMSIPEVIDTQLLLHMSSVRIDEDETRHSIERAFKPFSSNYAKPVGIQMCSAKDVESVLLKESLDADILKSLNMLTMREKAVTLLYFGIGEEHSWELDDIAERFNLTRDRTRQIKEKALRKLRHSNRSENLRAYLG